MKKVLKVIGIILLILIIIGIFVWSFILNYPNLKNDPKVDKWYKVETSKMKDSEGNKYHALLKKGKENKVMVYFAGGGVSVDEQTARNDTYNTKLVKPDTLANITMNMGGLASNVDGNPFKDWSAILFPYATGDFHSGTGEFKYIDKDGKEKTLYHNGYTNFTEAMNEIIEKAGIENSEAVLVTGYSAGGWGAALLAEDSFEYFQNAKSKTVVVDSSVALFNDWKYVAENVWKVPSYITERLKTDNITYDSLLALREKYGDTVNILFDSSTRDGSLTQVQRYFKDKILDESNGEMPIDESDGDIFQKTLKDFVDDLIENVGASVYIFDGIDWYDDTVNLTSHTAISTPAVFGELNDNKKSICDWIVDNMNANHTSYGVNLLDKEYPRKK